MWTLNGHLANERTDLGYQDFVSLPYSEFTVKLDLSFACIIRAESLSDLDFMFCKVVFGKPCTPLLTHSRPWNCLHLGMHKALCVQLERKIKAIQLRKFYFSHLWANISSSTYILRVSTKALELCLAGTRIEQESRGCQTIGYWPDSDHDLRMIFKIFFLMKRKTIPQYTVFGPQNLKYMSVVPLEKQCLTPGLENSYIYNIHQLSKWSHLTTKLK